MIADGKDDTTMEIPDMDRTNVYAYPNPSAGSVTIRFPVNSQKDIEVSIYDIDGVFVWKKQLNDYETRPGINTVIWAAQNEMGQDVSNGVYIFTVSDGSRVIKGKIAIVR